MNRISVFYEHMAEAMKQENITLDEVCAAVKRFGFDGVELDANRLKNEVGTILPALQKAGLSVNGIYNFFDFGSANGSPESDSTETLRIIRYCVKINCKFLLAVPGFLTEDEMVRGSAKYEARRLRMAASLTELTAAAAKRGITVVMEEFDNLTAPYSRADELMWFMQHVPGLRCGFDTGNFLYNEEDAVKNFSLFRPYIASVHCKDRTFTENTGSPCVTVANRKLYPVAVGDGNLPIEKMMRVLLDSGYTGSFA
ncbi:sugar phosphate isomerase/epimerase family protein, partial [Hominenteromicrobium sp.]